MHFGRIRRCVIQQLTFPNKTVTPVFRHQVENVFIYRKSNTESSPEVWNWKQFYNVFRYLTSRVNQSAPKAFCKVLIEIGLLAREVGAINLFKINKPVLENLILVRENPRNQLVICFVEGLSCCRITLVAQKRIVFQRV